MEFSKKDISEKLSGITLYGAEVSVSGNNVGNCPTNNNASGCGCSK